MTTLTRRHFIVTASLWGASACAGPLTSPRPAARVGRAGLPADLRPTPNAGFDAWVTGFRARARAAGITDATLSAGFANAGYLPGVVTRDNTQIEKRRTFEDYLSIAASDKRVANGRAALSRYRSTLDAIEARYGVEAEIVAAIWGMESSFGTRRGDIPVVSATATLAYAGRRKQFYEGQLVGALKILQRGDVDAGRLTGSWAGAMGHTQFIPTSYLAFAVDFTGDGRRDVWSDDPSDALASTAAYLAKNGWVRGLPWGAEAGPGAPSGRRIQPQPGGPSFVVTKNHAVLKRYNNSDSYAIGIGHLADRIAGGGPIQGRFPPDANGMSKSDRQKLQRLLTRAGFDTDGSDGVIGPDTQAAIRAYQASVGLPVNGQASLELLARLGG